MDALIQDLLAYGKLGHSPFPCERMDLAQPLAEALAMLNARVQSSHACISIQKPLLAVWANAEGIREVFLHLLGNALKFTAPGAAPQIRIWTENTGEKIRIWVEDKGIGFE